MELDTWEGVGKYTKSVISRLELGVIRDFKGDVGLQLWLNILDTAHSNEGILKTISISLLQVSKSQF